MSMTELWYCKKCKRYFWVFEYSEPKKCSYDDCHSTNIEFNPDIKPPSHFTKKTIENLIKTINKRLKILDYPFTLVFYPLKNSDLMIIEKNKGEYPYEFMFKSTVIDRIALRLMGITQALYWQLTKEIKKQTKEIEKPIETNNIINLKSGKVRKRTFIVETKEEKSKEKTYTTDLRVIDLDVTENYLQDWVKKHNIEKIFDVFLYDRNQLTYLAETTGSFWLQHLYTQVVPNTEENYEALEEGYSEDSSHYRNKYDISEDRGVKVEDLNFSYSDDKTYKENFDEAIEDCVANHRI